jgi:ATP phosphoribosyltransferase regulatory subunit
VTQSDRWLLPDGVEEILPRQALRVEGLRRRLLDLFQAWGYELVIPPLVEFTDSLLIGLGADMDLHSFKMVDQLSGRLLAIRPDITPQVARIDAHSLNRTGPARFCYAGTVAHTRPRSLLATRTPIQVGAELYGEAGVAADIEIICLMLETLVAAGLADICLDLGHVGIFQAMVDQAQLHQGAGQAHTQELFEALQRKAAQDISAAARQAGLAEHWVQRFVELAGCHGDSSVLDQASRLFERVPDSVSEAIAQLRAVASAVAARYAGRVRCYFDLAELRGYHYHTGLVFAALVPGFGQALANGGRYDDIGDVFGRGRPATGFSLELKALAELATVDFSERETVFAPHSEHEGYYDAVQAQRRAGLAVVCGMPGQPVPEGVERVLVHGDDGWRLRRAVAVSG